MSLIPQPPVAASAPINPEAARKHLRTGRWDDPSLLSLVIQDADKAESFESTKAFTLGWKAASTLYQSPHVEHYWRNTQTPRASVPLHVVATAVNSLVPQITNGLFYEDPPFMIRERPGTSSDTARAIQEILSYQLEDIAFKETVELGVTNVLLFGTGIWKWGWERFSQKRRVVKRVDNSVDIPSSIPGMPPTSIDPEEEEFDVQEIDEEVNRPTFEHLPNLRDILVDPSLNVPDIRKAKYVIHRMYMTFNDLDKLRGRDGYDIPSREEVLSWFLPPVEQPTTTESQNGHNTSAWDATAAAQNEETTIDPFNKPLEVLERWDGKQVITILQRKKIIGYDENVYGGIPFLSCNWWNVPEAFWGIGLGRVIGSEQRLQQGIIGSALDQMSLALNGVYTRKRGKSVPTQNIAISPGRVIDVDDKDDIGVLPRPNPVPEVIQYIEMSSSRVEQTSGSTESSTGVGGSSAHSNLGRTAAGANMLASGSGNRISHFVERLSTQVFLPFLYAMYEMNKLLLPVKTWKSVLNKELASAYLATGGSIEEILNARVAFSVTAGAKMQERRNMAQSLPILLQFLMNPEMVNGLAVQEYTVDYLEATKMIFETSGWKNRKDVIRPMTPQEKQRAQQQSPVAVAQAKGQIQRQNSQESEQQKFENRAQLLEQSNLQKATGEVLRRAIEESATPDTVTGEPGGQGFGSQA